jgi:hypothetical protein
MPIANLGLRRAAALLPLLVLTFTPACKLSNSDAVEADKWEVVVKGRRRLGKSRLGGIESILKLDPSDRPDSLLLDLADMWDRHQENRQLYETLDPQGERETVLAAQALAARYCPDQAAPPEAPPAGSEGLHRLCKVLSETR